MFSQGLGGVSGAPVVRMELFESEIFAETPLFVTTSAIFVTQRVIKPLVHTMYTPGRIMTYSTSSYRITFHHSGLSGLTCGDTCGDVMQYVCVAGALGELCGSEAGSGHHASRAAE